VLTGGPDTRIQAIRSQLRLGPSLNPSGICRSHLCLFSEVCDSACTGVAARFGRAFLLEDGEFASICFADFSAESRANPAEVSPFFKMRWTVMAEMDASFATSRMRMPESRRDQTLALLIVFFGRPSVLPSAFAFSSPALTRDWIRLRSTSASLGECRDEISPLVRRVDIRLLVAPVLHAVVGQPFEGGQHWYAPAASAKLGGKILI
jgi:hypothetical protein